MPKPGTIPEFASGVSAAIVAPTTNQKATGWIVRQRPPAAYMNWLFYWIYKWIEWLNSMTGADLAVSGTDARKIDVAILAAETSTGAPVLTYGTANAAARIASITNQGTSTTITRGARGLVTTITGGGKTTTITRDASGRITSITEA